jgi:nicotinate dehydrogenase subunit B
LPPAGAVVVSPLCGRSRDRCGVVVEGGGPAGARPGHAVRGPGWGPKGPASIHRARAALDNDGAVIAYVFESKGFSRIDIDTNESDPAYSLAGQLIGLPLKSLQGFGVPTESYGFANKRLAWETIPPLLDRASPLRTAHLRDPVGPQIQFAGESFIDEIAAAVGTDPVAFRLRYLKEPRDIAVRRSHRQRRGCETRLDRRYEGGRPADPTALGPTD